MISVPLTRGLSALVDDEDAWVLHFKWHAVPRLSSFGGHYAARAIAGRRKLYLHRAIMSEHGSALVDHRNGDGLDCRRTNLRLTNPSGNAANARTSGTRSGYRGVYLTAEGNYKVEVGGKGCRVRGGTFSSPEVAARKYDELASEMFGEFATLNFGESA